VQNTAFPRPRIPPNGDFACGLQADFHSSGNRPLHIVALILTPQYSRRRIRYLARSIGAPGRQRALSTGMDRAVHQSRVPGSRTLVARRCGAGGALQQLRPAAAQRTAAPKPAVEAQAASADDLPAEPANSVTSFAFHQFTCLRSSPSF